MPLYLSQLKSRAWPGPLAPDVILLTADTVVVLDGEVLGKPRGPRRGRRNARAACRDAAHIGGFGRHAAHGGADAQLRGAARTSGSARSRPRRPNYYIDTYRPFDKAGSYGIQEWIGYAAIERIEGSFYNVMGLPIQKVYVELDKFLDR